MTRPPTRSTQRSTLFPYTTLFRSRHHTGPQAPGANVDAPAEPVPRRARRRDPARSSAAPLRGAATAGVSDAEAVAPRAGEGRRGAGLRRIPQLDARADRRARAANAVGAGGRPGRRPGEARALRR